MYFNDDFDRENYFQGIKKLLDKAQFDPRDKTSFYEFKDSSVILTELTYEYSKEYLMRVLEHENYGKDSLSFLNIATAQYYFFLIEPFIEKMLDEKIEEANSMLTEFKITRDYIQGKTSTHKLEEIDNIILNLTLEKLEPLELLDKFLNSLDIQLVVGNKDNKIKYCVPYYLRKDKRKKWYYCNSIIEMLTHIKEDMTQQIMKSFTDDIESKYTDDNQPFVAIDIDVIKMLKTPEQLYEYLKTIDIARIELQIDWLYVLSNYKKISMLFTSEEEEQLIKQIKKKEYIKQLAHKAKKEEEKTQK